MRIAIDATPLMKAHRSGVGQYLKNLIGGFAVAAPAEEYLLCYRLSRFSRREHRLAPPGASFRSRWFHGPVHPCGADVVHGPDGRLVRWRKAASVVTVHDVFSLVSDEYASGKFREKKRRRYEEIARRADRIIFVSGWTRDMFLDRLPVGEDRFVVIPEGVDDGFRPEASAGAEEVSRRYGIPGPYVVFVGQLSTRKNIAGMLEAYRGMPADAPCLVLAGAPSHGHRDIAAEIEGMGLTGRVVLAGYVSDEYVPALIAGSECLLFPSFLEGFGLPALEAMACGTPLVSSDRGALAETAGGVRVLVDPEEPDSIREGVLKVLSDRGLREDLRSRGLERAAQFRWPTVAARTLSAYREARS